MRTILLFLTAALIGCAADAEEPAPYQALRPAPNGDASLSERPAVQSDTSDDGGAPKSEGPTEYVGRLPATNPVSYSGGCSYRVTMKDVMVTLGVDGDRIVSAAVESTMTETAVGGCGTKVISPNTHKYVLPADFMDEPPDGGAGDAGAGPRKFSLMRGEGVPRSTMSMEVQKHGEGYDVTLSWKRDDNQQSSLMWKVTARLSLVKS
jgi:hypothetical protein